MTPIRLRNADCFETPVARRQLLRGAAGFALGLPFLPSLLPRTAHAIYTQPKFFAAFATGHGGAFSTNMHPEEATLTSAIEIHPGHTARFGPLVARNEGNERVLSNVIRASTSALTDRIVGKMNVLRSAGDIAFGISHNTGGHLGNFTAVADGPGLLLPAIPTIDRLMAYSPNFYSNMVGIRQRGIAAGNDAGLSWEHSNPVAGTGPVQRVSVERSSLALFDTLVAGVGANQPPPPVQRKAIVDRILASYRNLRQSNRRLSTDDRRRLDDHIARLSELETRLQNAGTSAHACSITTRPKQSWDLIGNGQGNPADGVKFYGLLNDVIAMAFSCGTTRIASIYVSNPMTTYAGNWHQDVVHLAKDPANQLMLIDSMRRAFQVSFLDLATKLDAIEYSPGKTLLDQSLLQWTQESGSATHTSLDTATVTCGSAAGFFKTGMFVDYRNRNAKRIQIGDTEYVQPGLTQRQWLATVMQSMGLERSEFERNGQPGYGDPFIDPGANAFAAVVRPEVLSRASDVMPIISAN